MDNIVGFKRGNTVIKNSLDFPRVEIELQGLLSRLKNPQHRFDGMKILRNMTRMVNELSKFELQMRRTAGHNPSKVQAQLSIINEEINNLEQWAILLLLY